MSGRTSGKVLIVDADPPFVSAMTESFGKVGFKVLQTHTHEGALELARTEKPDIILLSVELPAGVAEGYLICKDLKTDPALSSIPVIILSRKAREEDFERHRKLKTRADAYLRKPVTDADLIAKVEDLLGFQLTPVDYSSLEEKLHTFLEEKQLIEENLREREREILDLKGEIEELKRRNQKLRDYLTRILGVTTELHEEAEKLLKELI
jgi:CheY-like chemotaxis protein